MKATSQSGLLRFIAGATVFALATSATAQQFPVVDILPLPQAVQTVPGRLIVKLREQGASEDILPVAQARNLGLSPAPQHTSGGELVYDLSFETILQLGSAQGVEERVRNVVQTLSARADVEYAQPVYRVHPLLEPNDTHYNKQWHYRVNGSGAGQSPGGINLPTAWDTTTGAVNVTVAVIDTGILPAHPDIAGSGNGLAGYDMISSLPVANDGGGRDADPTDPGDAVLANECYPGSPARSDSWHGTHVAGTVGIVATNNAAGVAGIAWKVSVLPVRVLGKCGGSTVDINDAIRWAAGLPVPGVPVNPKPAHVINMSLGADVPCTNSPSTQAAINDAVSAGATVVVAAGNSAMDAANSFPASCDNVITVAASDARGHLVTRYSNFGETVEIMAPGGDVRRDDDGDGYADGVLSTVQGGFAFFNGTSMAAPHVAGAAALLIADDPSLSPKDVLTRIVSTALPRTSTHCPEACGAGLLNLGFGIPPEQLAFNYPAKLLCGMDEDFREQGRTEFDTIINVRNPGDEDVKIRKTLALGIPPGNQAPGKLVNVADDVIPARHAIAFDCEDVIRRAFSGTSPAPLLDGYLVVESPASLDVTAVYRTIVSDEGKVMATDLEVESVTERRHRTE